MMKRTIIILITAFLSIGCSKTLYVKNNGNYPDTFKVKDKTTLEDMVFYFDEDYYIYHKRDKMEIGETRTIRPFFFNRYLKLKK